jgi:hypothetical protein
MTGPDCNGRQSIFPLDWLYLDAVNTHLCARADAQVIHVARNNAHLNLCDRSHRSFPVYAP